jgi:pilus assembly protein CpaE
LLHSVIVCPDIGLAKQLEAAVSVASEVSVARVIDRYPPAVDLARALRAHAPEVVFLSFEVPEKAVELVKFIEAEGEGVQIVAIHSACDAKILRETMRAGVREFLAVPFEQATVLEALRNVRDLLERRPVRHHLTNQVFAFLPAKAGVGTSTLALNVSAAMSRRADGRVLLSDFDLSSGMLRFMLKLQNEYCVLDAMEHCTHIDENLWPQLVTTFDAMDVLHAGRINPNLRIEQGQIRNLTAFMRRNYSAICFDLSGNLERYSLEIMEESKRVLLVCTPEIPSLHLAREKLTFLRQVELDARVAIVLNRCHKKPLFTKEQVEDVLGMPVLRMFGNDYFGVNRAVTSGKWLDPNSELGKEFDLFAAELLDKKAPAGPPPKKRFLEYFAVSEMARSK